MDGETLKKMLQNKKIGVKNVNDMDEIMSKVRRIEFNNDVTIMINPKDKTTVLTGIDYENGILETMMNDMGRWRPAIKLIELIETVVGLATEISPDGTTFITENEKGEQFNHLSSKNNQTNRPYTGNVFDEINKIGN